MGDENFKEKTEEPTKRKLKRSREEGEVAKSQELATAMFLVGSILLIWGCSRFLNQGFKESFYRAFSRLHAPTIDGILSFVFKPLVAPLSIILLGIMVFAFWAHVLQTGWIWSLKKRGSKPIQGKFYALFLAFLKLVVIAGIGFLVLKNLSFPIFASPMEKQKMLFRELFYLLVGTGAALLLIGLIDLIYQRWLFYKKMRMTRTELKEEQKEVEGDLLTKEKMRKRKK